MLSIPFGIYHDDVKRLVNMFNNFQFLLGFILLFTARPRVRESLSIPFGIYHEELKVDEQVKYIAFNPFWDLSYYSKLLHEF